MLDVRRLRLLRELAHRGTIAAVAGALAYTPSAVSQQLAALEREAGVPLLARTGRRVVLTPAGAVLVQHAETVLAALEEAAAARPATPTRPRRAAGARGFRHRRSHAAAGRPGGPGPGASPAGADGARAGPGGRTRRDAHRPARRRARP